MSTCFYTSPKGKLTPIMRHCLLVAIERGWDISIYTNYEDILGGCIVEIMDTPVTPGNIDSVKMEP